MPRLTQIIDVPRWFDARWCGVIIHAMNITKLPLSAMTRPLRSPLEVDERPNARMTGQKCRGRRGRGRGYLVF